LFSLGKNRAKALTPKTQPHAWCQFTAKNLVELSIAAFAAALHP